MKEYNFKLEKADWRKIKDFQPDDFKNVPPKEFEKLKSSLKRVGITQPFFAWKNKGEIYTLDGHRRKKAFYSLIKEGEKIPDLLSMLFIDAKSKKEAKQLLLTYNYHYGRVNQDSLDGFVIDLDLGKLEKEAAIPDIVIELLPESNEIVDDELPENVKKVCKEGDLWELGLYYICPNSKKTVFL